MPPLAPNPVNNLWPHDPYHQDLWSRSLWFERFADPRLRDDTYNTPRREFFEQGIKLKAVRAHSRAWLQFLRQELALPWNDLRFAQLQARLLVNAGGGVMQNAGLALDRFSGQPFVPGAAVKGCARRSAIQELHALGAGWLPPEGTPETDSQRHERIQECAALLANIVRVFGWTEQEWNRRDDYRPERRDDESDAAFQKRWETAWRKKRSDFAWACGNGLWEPVRTEVATRLAMQMGIPQHPDHPFWRRVRNHAGLGRFLPAYPVDVTLGEPASTPEVGKLELDLLASHHRRYHEGDPHYDKAPDTEDPNLVFFPTVAAGHVFVFAVLVEDGALVKTARDWLMQGLEIFGLGAKTSSGYGWFLEVSQCAAALLARQEELAPWRKRAEHFTDLLETEKEREALAFAAATGIWQELKKERIAGHLRNYLLPREAALDDTMPQWLPKALHFGALEVEEQQQLAYDVIEYDAALRRAQPHFPNLLNPLLACLDTL
jgi:CRISPR/Cas system CMR subunit Cmr6 (Cas7 group RAMP superfamily)